MTRAIFENWLVRINISVLQMQSWQICGREIRAELQLDMPQNAYEAIVYVLNM